MELIEKLLIKPLVAGWLEDGRTNELRNERKCRRQQSAHDEKMEARALKGGKCACWVRDPPGQWVGSARRAGPLT